MLGVVSLSLFFFTSALTPDENNLENSETENNGYIIKYKEKPILLKEAELKEIAFKNVEKINSYSDYNPIKYIYPIFAIEPDEIYDELNQHKNKVEKEHSRVEREIIDELDSSSLTGKVVDDSSSIIVEEYTNSFNGALVMIDEKDIEKISSLEDVEAVYPNSKLELNLDKSIPFLNVDSAPYFTDPLGRALTGEGVRVGIIDSGVDYTHPDFGSCFGDNIQTNSLLEDSSFDGNFLAYSSLQPDGCFDYETMFSRNYLDAESLTRALISAYDGALCLNDYGELNINLIELLEVRKELFINSIQTNPDSAFNIPQLS